MSEEPPSLARDFGDAAVEVERAREIYVARQKDAQAARRFETDALNTLNNAQRRFDKLVEQLRSASPQQSDWKRSPPEIGVEA